MVRKERAVRPWPPSHARPQFGALEGPDAPPCPVCPSSVKEEIKRLAGLSLTLAPRVRGVAGFTIPGSGATVWRVLKPPRGQPWEGGVAVLSLTGEEPGLGSRTACSRPSMRKRPLQPHQTGFLDGRLAGLGVDFPKPFYGRRFHQTRSVCPLKSLRRSRQRGCWGDLVKQ